MIVQLRKRKVYALRPSILMTEGSVIVEDFATASVHAAVCCLVSLFFFAFFFFLYLNTFLLDGRKIVSKLCIRLLKRPCETPKNTNPGSQQSP